MNFNKHLNIKGHAFMGASQYQWLRYDDNKIAQVYINALAKEKGTELHDFAAKCIELGQKLPKSHKTINMHVNDAIGFKMKPEQILYYSDNCFGTADAISFRNNKLRIHDLKTGVTPAHMDQLMIYAALFCLEYRYNPSSIDIELRIYQLDDVQVLIPEPDLIKNIMDKIVRFDKIINHIKEQEDE